MHTIPAPALPGRSEGPTKIWPTLAIAALASAGAIVVSLATPPVSTASLSGAPSAAAPATRDVSLLDRRCRA